MSQRMTLAGHLEARTTCFTKVARSLPVSRQNKKLIIRFWLTSDLPVIHPEECSRSGSLPISG